MPQHCEPSSNKWPWLVWPLISAFQCSISLKWDKHTGRGEVITKIEQHSNGVGPWSPIISTTSPTDLYSPSSKGDKQRDQWRSSSLTSDNHQDFPIHSNGVTLWPWIISARYIPSHQNETNTRQGREDGHFAFPVQFCAKTTQTQLPIILHSNSWKWDEHKKKAAMPRPCLPWPIPFPYLLIRVRPPNVHWW